MSGEITEQKKSGRYLKYNVWWEPLVHPALVEMDCIRMGGRWKKKNGEMAGEGLEFHFRRLMQILWPELLWESNGYKNYWAEECLKAYVSTQWLGVLGCAAAGKSAFFGAIALADWYCRPHDTTVMVTSTDLKALELRIWGMIKKYHKNAVQRCPWLPGHIIEGKQMLLADSRDEAEEGRDFKAGIVAIATKKGSQYVGIGCFVAGTPVDTPNGQVPIESIKPGDVVMSAIGPRKVRATQAKLTQDLVVIKTVDGRKITCTSNHPFFAGERQWVEAGELMPGDHLMSPNETINAVYHAAGQSHMALVNEIEPDDEWQSVNPDELARPRTGEAAGPGTVVESVTRILLWNREWRLVYNLEVAGHPSYCVRGLVCHNSWVGVHSPRIRMIADELALMNRAFLDSASNLSKCPDFKLVGIGNPSETTNAHGILCEPHPDIGGWEGGIDQEPKTKTWKTRFPNGMALQLPGSDSPNMQAGPDEEPPFPFLMTRKQMEDDAAIWGKDDWRFSMMNDAKMPRGQGSRRVITRQMCVKFGAFEPPNFRDTRRRSIAFLDAAYRGSGGDRCVFGELQFGPEIVPQDNTMNVSALIEGTWKNDRTRNIIALIDLMVIPISGEPGAESPEDQIVGFVMKECNKRGIPASDFFYDAGMRTSLVTAFSRLWSPEVESIDFGGKPSDEYVSAEINKRCSEYYNKFVTELWFNVRLAIESGQFRGMTEELCREFSMREWKMTSNNRIEVETKAEMKVKSGRSPDLADAVAAGVYGARKRGFIITKMSDLRPQNPKELRWKEDLKRRAYKTHRSGALNYAA